VSSFYIVNAVERPYYWFPYGFSRSKIPYYQELYPHALREVSEGKNGFIYEINADESQVKPFNLIPGAWLGTSPMVVVQQLDIIDAYEWFLKLETEKRLIIRRYEDLKPEQLEWWYKAIIDYLTTKKMINNPDCSYAKFIQEKFPQVWQDYFSSSLKDLN
jgi:hypothetical protein